MGFSPNYWSAVENDRTVLARDKLAKLNGLFEFDDEEARSTRDSLNYTRRPRDRDGGRGMPTFWTTT